MKNLLMLMCFIAFGTSALASEQTEPSMPEIHGVYKIKLIKEFNDKANTILEKNISVSQDGITPVDMTMNDKFSQEKFGFNFEIKRLGTQYVMNIIPHQKTYNDLIPLEDHNDFSSNLNRDEPKHHYYQAFDFSHDLNIDTSKIFDISVATDSSLVIGKEYLEITKEPDGLKR